MNRQNAPSIVVKIGTDTMMLDDSLDKKVMWDIARQIAELRESMNVVLVTSGAIGSARSLMSPDVLALVQDRRQALSSIGQAILMQQWNALLDPHNIQCAQMLVEDYDLEDVSGRQNILTRLSDYHQIEQAWERGILPVVNGNDPLTAGPIKSDNDVVASKLADLIGARGLVYLTNVDGVYTDHPKKDGAQLVREIDVMTDDWQRWMSDEKSQNGTGSMRSKCEGADAFVRQRRSLHAQGSYRAYIGSGKTQGAIHRLLAQEIGTLIS